MPASSEVFVARFPGQTCTVCGAEFVPGETEIVVDPNTVGPKGGKRHMHAHGCARSNPPKRKVRAADIRDMDDMTPSERAEIERALRDFYARQAQGGISYPRVPATRKNPGMMHRAALVRRR
jgi:hypothetical protein